MLVLMHSPKGGVGTTFLTAQLAMHLAERGHEVTAIDLTFQDSLKLYFGVRPSQATAQWSSDEGDVMVVNGVELLNGYAFAHEERFASLLGDAQADPFEPERVTLVDVASGARELKRRLLERCDLHICPLLPLPGSLATLPLVDPDTATTALTKTVFVLNQLDDTRRLSRHSHSFVRELLGESLLGSVRRDEGVNEALAMFEPLAKYTPASVVRVDIDRLADAVEERLGLGSRERTVAAALQA
jgi:chromosome partitioning protein